MKRLLFLALTLVACKGAAASPPKPIVTFALHRGALLAPDTLVGTFTCTAAAPTTSCGVTVTATGGTIDTARTSTSVAVGSQGTVAIVCNAPGPVTFTGSLFGIAPGLSNSPPTAAVTLPLTCPAKAANSPGAFVIQFVVKSGG